MAHGVNAVFDDTAMNTRSLKIGIAVGAGLGLIIPSIACGDQRVARLTTLQDMGAKAVECSREQQKRFIDEEVDRQVNVRDDERSLASMFPPGPEQKKRIENARKQWREFLQKRWEIHDFDIPAMPLGDFMRKFGEQTNLVACYSSGFNDKVMVGPLRGRFLSGEAASMVQTWAGTDPAMGLDGTIHFKTKTEFTRIEDIRFNPNAHLMCDPEPAVRRRRPVRRGCPSAYEFITVEASRLSSSIARLIGGDNPTVTSIVIQQPEIESSGAATLGELFRRQPQIPYMRGPEARVSGEQYADLRGFGSGTTIVLINGRRVGATATSFDNSAFDVNTVPLAAVKQIEILPDSHLALGADAIGGVINIALKDDIPDPVIELKYGAADAGAEEGRASLGIGVTRDRFRGTATLDVYQREFLFGAARDLTRDQDFRRFGRLDMRSMDALPPNIRSLTGANLPGLASSFAAVPAGNDSPSIADFAETAGQLNLVSANSFRSIVPQTKKISGVATAEYHLLDNATLFGEILGVERENRLQIGPPAIRGAVIPATNPFNPFGEAVIVNALVDGMGATTWVTETTSLRSVLGATAYFDEWAAQFSATWHDEHANMFRENHLDPAKVMQALAATDHQQTLNFFRDGPPASQELLRSLRADRGNDGFDSQSLNAHFSVQGPVFNLGADEVWLMVGGEWRQEELTTPALVTQRQIASAAFGELRLPLVTSSMEITGTETIDLSLGVRRDYDDFGTHLNSQYALSWRPMSQLRILVSYRDFFRAPNLNDLHMSRISGGLQLPDPHRNYQLGSFIAVFGGNPSLTPNTGRAWTASLDYAPSNQTSLSASYWNSAIHNRITYLTIPFALNHEARFPDRVIRAQPTPQDTALGLSGRLISVDVSPGNYGELKADGMDFSIKSSWPTRFGRLTPTVTATWNRSFTTATAGLQPQQRVAVGSDEGTIPRWRAVASVDLERNIWSLFSALRFTSSYDDALLGVKNGRSIGTSIQLDAQVSIQLDAFTSRPALEGIKFTAGAHNLLDAEPEYSEVFGTYGYDYTQADLRQRFWYVAVEKTF